MRTEDVEAVSKMLSDVKARGDAAVNRYTNRFDSPDFTIDEMKVTETEMASRKTGGLTISARP